MTGRPMLVLMGRKEAPGTVPGERMIKVSSRDEAAFARAVQPG